MWRKFLWKIFPLPINIGIHFPLLRPYLGISICFEQAVGGNLLGTKNMSLHFCMIKSMFWYLKIPTFSSFSSFSLTLPLLIFYPCLQLIPNETFKTNLMFDTWRDIAVLMMLVFWLWHGLIFIPYIREWCTGHTDTHYPPPAVTPELHSVLGVTLQPVPVSALEWGPWCKARQ